MVGVEQMMRFLSERLAEIVAIERLHVGIFVREAQRFALVEPPERTAGATCTTVTVLGSSMASKTIPVSSRSRSAAVGQCVMHWPQ